MTIKKISKLVSLILAIIIISFAIAVSWSLSHLNHSFASVKFFGEQKDKVFTEITQPILNYVLTGEATILGKVENSLDTIKSDVEGNKNISSSLQTPFVAMIDELQQKTLLELKAAGKLADPQTLLINNEKQLAKDMSKLLLYVKEANTITLQSNESKNTTVSKSNKKTKQKTTNLSGTQKELVLAENTKKYLTLIADTQSALMNLTKARQNFFTSRKQMSVDNVTHPLQELTTLTDTFKELPLLGVMEKVEAKNETLSFDTAETKEPEDKAIEPINEIQSLVKHYNKDLELALKITEDKITGQAKVSEQIGNLQQRLLALTAELTAEYQFYEHLMFVIMAGCLLLIVSAISICILGGKRILQRVSDLETTMSNIAETSDLSLRAEASHNDEIGNMARSFNSMVEKLQETSKLVKQKINDIQTMLQNMPQGLLSFGEENVVNPEYSAHLEKILETNQIHGSDLITLIFDNSDLGSDSVSQIAAVAGACIGEDVMNFEFNQHLLVNEIEKEMPDGKKKVLDLNWAPVTNENDDVEQILLCVRDVTELRKLSEEAAVQKRELEVIGEILKVSQEKFHDFITSSITRINEIENIIRDNPDGGEEAINLMFRNMHTIKGNARTYGLTHLTDPVHEIESGYSELRKTDSLIAWDQARLLEELAQLRDLVEYYAKVNEVTLGRKGAGRRGNVDKYLMVEIRHIQEVIQLLEKVGNTNIHDLIDAKNVAHQTLKLFGTEPLDVTLASITDSLPELAGNLGKSKPNVVINNGRLRLKTQSVGIIKDIFTHLFRNCVDHGLEVATERLEKGKSAQGRIDVNIKEDGEQIKIAIKDDGRGLALGKIREKAIADGRLTENETVSDEQIAAFIFLPGLSTAEQLTDVSGRGVGMDAVLGFAKKEGGNVEINFLDDNEGADRRAFETVVHLPIGHAVRL